jgi:hypothetical protein
MRELPPGWVRSFDAQEQHQFFVDTTANPPRSIWVHPYDDEQYLATLSPEERQKHSRMHRTMTLNDIAAEDSDDEAAHKGKTSASSAGPQPTGIHKFSRKLKDKITGQTHEQREQQRVERAEQERQAYLSSSAKTNRAATCTSSLQEVPMRPVAPMATAHMPRTPTPTPM